MRLDNKDREILYHLDINSRQHISQIAKKIHIPKANVGYRIKRLQELGIIKNFYTVIDAFKLGYTSLRFYLIFKNTNPDIEKEIIDYFKKNNYTWWVGSIRGRYNLVVIVWVKSMNEFYSFWEKTLLKYRKYFAKQIFSPYTQLLHYRYSFLIDNCPSTDRTKFEITGGDNQVDYDNLDFQILKIIAPNSRIPTTEIAKKVNITSKTVRSRIQRLIKIGVIQGYRVQIDYTKLNYQYYKVDIYLRDYSQLQKIISYIKANNNLILIDRSVGLADLELEFYVNNPDHLRDIMNDLIVAFPDTIENYQYFYLSDIHKIQYIPD